MFKVADKKIEIKEWRFYIVKHLMINVFSSLPIEYLLRFINDFNIFYIQTTFKIQHLQKNISFFELKT